LSNIPVARLNRVVTTGSRTSVIPFIKFSKQVCSTKQVLYEASDEAVYHIL